MAFDFEGELQLKGTESALVSQHTTYLQEHPEVRKLVSDFLASCLLTKPNNIYAAARAHFHSFVALDAPQFNPVIITGPSGVGKGTLIERLLKDHPDTFGLSVSHTTRSPRPGEIPGYHYHFSSVEEMKRGIERGDFIEYATVHDNLYGTSKKAIESVVKLGKICVLDIDVQGCESVKKSGLSCKYIFIAPPSEEELRKRLVGRQTETMEKIERRLMNAKKEMAYMHKEGFFDEIIVNDNLDVAYNALKKLLGSEIEARQLHLFPSPN